MALRPLRIGTRGSPMALYQANLVRDRLIAAHPGLAEPGMVELVIIRTTGDRVQNRLLAEIGALFIAAVLLANRKITSRTMIAAVDWPLLLLVACLFAVTGALNQAGVAASLLEFLSSHDLLPNGLVPLTLFSVLTSNAIGSLPAAMLLLQIWPTPPPGVLYALALLSTLAGNLLLSGSLTNVLIAERAERMGAPLSFADHARAGVPIAVISLAFAIFWLSVTHTLSLWPTPLPVNQ